MRLFQRESGGLGLRLQLRSGEGAEFSALKDFQAALMSSPDSEEIKTSLNRLRLQMMQASSTLPK